MPNYTFLNKETEEEIIVEMPMSELDSFLQNNPNLSQILTATAIASGAALMGRRYSKPDSGFRDLLKQVKKSNRGSKINTF